MDTTTTLMCVVAVIIVGVVALLKGGSKWGILIIAAGIAWGWYATQGLRKEAQPGTVTPEQSQRGYYKKPSQ